MARKPRDSLRCLRAELEDLRSEVRALRAQQAGTIETALLRRGHTLQGMNPEQLALVHFCASQSDREVFYYEMRRYSFRLLLRDVIARRQGFVKGDVCRYASEPVTQRDLDLLLRLGVLTKRRTTYKLASPEVASFGETLEWYVSSVFEREFRFASGWGVLLPGENIKGDYDVLASAEGRLIYVETKSSPPKNIHESEVSEFVSRIKYLGPDMAVFLVDTELRLEDKILKLFRSVLPAAMRRELRASPKPQPVYRTQSALCIVNSKRDIVTNLRECLKALFQAPWPV